MRRYSKLPVRKERKTVTNKISCRESTRKNRFSEWSSRAEPTPPRLIQNVFSNQMTEPIRWARKGVFVFKCYRKEKRCDVKTDLKRIAVGFSTSDR
jgi:hypothetical protein